MNVNVEVAPLAITALVLAGVIESIVPEELVDAVAVTVPETVPVFEMVIEIVYEAPTVRLAAVAEAVVPL